MKDSLHPDVQKFKQFVKKHPYVLRDVKSGEKSLQDLFEEWSLFGEDDEIWETYKANRTNKRQSESNASDEENVKSEKNGNNENVSAQDLLSMFKRMNLNDLQNHLAQFNGVLTSVQELLGQFKQNPTGGSGAQDEQQSSPFSFRED
ncbi:YlbD family protein [Evansella halocellulosilytica]|uniref:YlbD family protein n=1 Tax=Evansella halocellulosilytica TaxID=2011013 RepID=UPI0015CCBB09|nr:YlbD family protein [Evansella halocellulosilytica]